jgi:uncharacterized protein YndB with AHSA1/START domain
MTRDIRWRLHLASPPPDVYQALTTDSGRASFWAESAEERDGWIEWGWAGGLAARTQVLAMDRPHLFRLGYFGGSVVTFELVADGTGGTDLTLTDVGVAAADWEDTRPGWVSVLLALKAYVDHGVDLRNHDAARTWESSYVDN